ncbi:deoxynucleoside triphosphate triphosphohydrolase SAMHD1 isoform X2 [Thrips palmi]|nr:deoxynucleoside triphosphate triphosphohydrolase SAMHD1 isoform X2 [Thrips palmi]
MDREGSKNFKLFQDSVHGVMRFHPLIVKFIDTKVFQRMRNIKQLSTTYLVFPAAAHNRFEHSLGVCYLAGEVMDELEKNSPNVWKEILPDPKESEAVKLAIQIAGLLHDLGHGPFSHTWEVFVQACGGDWDHEHTSCALIDLMIWKSEDGKEPIQRDDNLTELGWLFKAEFNEVNKYIQFIKDVIIGVTQDKIKEPKRAFLYQVVANKFNDIDVDKYDYFLRDAQHLKMNVSFDYQRLIKLCRISYDDNKMSHIAFRDVEKYSIQGMFRVRADLHIRAYQHRVVKNLEIMLIDALKEADAKYLVRGLRLSQVHENPAIFATLTDSIQELLLYSEEPELESTRELLDRLATRNLYKIVGEWPLKVAQSEEEKLQNRAPKGLNRKILNELEEILEGKYALTQVGVNQGKYFDPLANVKFFPKHERRMMEGNVPQMKMELPFFKVLVFKRGREEDNLEDLKKKAEDFLKTKGILFLNQGQ